MAATLRSYVRFILPASASARDLSDVARRIAAECLKQRATRAMVVAAGNLEVSRKELRDVVIGLSEEGCLHGFKLAFVAAHREAYEELVQAEDAGIRAGITTRIFFDEKNAARWLDEK
jgi:hypothetical protein